MLILEYKTKSLFEDHTLILRPYSYTNTKVLYVSQRAIKGLKIRANKRIQIGVLRKENSYTIKKTLIL